MGEKGREEQWALPGPHSSSSCLSPPHPEKAQLSDSSQAGHLACPH